VTTKRRINQHFFRKMVLSNYDEACTICNLNYPALLVASHIIPWSKDREARLNPHNGLCLCSIHDKAFDRGLISLDGDLRVIISKEASQINTIAFNRYFGHFNGQPINRPLAKIFYAMIRGYFFA
jgi:predicted restriction endonuclease